MPRLTKFYSPIHQSQQTLVEKIYALVSGRPAGLCNFLDAPELEAFLKPKDGDGEKLRVVYRSYATLYFVFVVDSAESELGILDLIQVSGRHADFFGACGGLHRPQKETADGRLGMYQKETECDRIISTGLRRILG